MTNLGGNKANHLPTVFLFLPHRSSLSLIHTHLLLFCCTVASRRCVMYYAVQFPVRVNRNCKSRLRQSYQGTGYAGNLPLCEALHYQLPKVRDPKCLLSAPPVHHRCGLQQLCDKRFWDAQWQGSHARVVPHTPLRTPVCWRKPIILSVQLLLPTHFPSFFFFQQSFFPHHLFSGRARVRTAFFFLPLLIFLP